MNTDLRHHPSHGSKSTQSCARCGHSWTPRVASPVQCPACHSSYWRKARVEDRTGAITLFAPLFGLLNKLKEEEVIRDWVLFGSVAFIYHDEVIVTRDVDIVVECTVEDYTGIVLPTLRTYAPETAPGVFDLGIKKMQVVPTADKKIFPEMLERAIEDKVEGVPVKIAIPEHLVIEALDRWSDRKGDAFRVIRLYPLCNRKYVYHLVKKYEKSDGRLIKNIKSLRPFISGPLFG